MAEVVEESPTGVTPGTPTTSTAQGGTSANTIIPLVQDALAEGTTVGEGPMATVQLGDLSGHSVQELAEHLPNIGIHFTCKKCNINCSQVRTSIYVYLKRFSYWY